MTASKKTYTGGRFQLDIAGHNVGYLRSTPSDFASPGPGSMAFRAGVSLQPFASMAEFVAAVRRSQPAGVHGILIGLHPLPRQQPVAGKDGTVGILIGLLLPAVQRLIEPGSSELVLLAGALRQGGWLGFVGADGSFQPLGKQATAVPLCLQG